MKKILTKFSIVILFTIAIAFIFQINSEKVLAAGNKGNLTAEIKTQSCSLSACAEIYYQITDSANGEYLCFDENLNYTGKQTEENTIIVEKEKIIFSEENRKYTVTFKNIPNGNYTISFATYNENAIAKKQNDYDKIYFEGKITNPNFNINNSNADLLTKILGKCENNIYFYYKDYVGDMNEIYYSYRSNGEEGDYKFNYEKDENGNNIYTYSEVGTIQEVKVVDGEVTIIKGVPYYTSGGFFIAADPNYGDRLSSLNGNFMFGNSSYNLGNHIMGGGTSFTGPHTKNVWFVLINTSDKKVLNIKKKGTDGKIANSKFTLNDKKLEKQTYFEHYDEYEYKGKTYKNVYLVKGVVEEENSNEANTIIETKNGEAVVIFPKVNYDGTDFNGTKYSLHEIATDDSHIRLQNDSLVKDLENKKYTITSIINGVTPAKSSIPFTGKQNDIDMDFSDFSFDLLELYFDAEESNDETAEDKNEIEETIINTNRPKVSKMVIDENNNKIENDNETFKFGLFDEEFNLISTVEIKNNEAQYFDVQTENPEQAKYFTYGKYYIVEMLNDNYELVDAIENGVTIQGTKKIINEEIKNKIEAEINEKIDVKAFQFTSTDNGNVDIIFKNKKTKIEDATQPVEPDENTKQEENQQEETPEQEDIQKEANIEKENIEPVQTGDKISFCIALLISACALLVSIKISKK